MPRLRLRPAKLERSSLRALLCRWRAHIFPIGCGNKADSSPFFVSVGVVSGIRPALGPDFGVIVHDGIIMIVRNTYRLTEYAQGDDGYLDSNKQLIYSFDTVPMALVMAVTLFWYTIKVQPKVANKLSISHRSAMEKSRL